MTKPTPQVHEDAIVCPYCLHEHDPGTVTEAPHLDGCQICGKEFTVWKTVTTTFHAVPLVGNRLQN